MFLLAAFTPRRSLRPYLYTLGAARRLAAPALRCGFTSLDSGNMFKTNLPKLFPLNCSGNKDGGTENCAGHKRPRHSGSSPTVRSVCAADALASAVSGEFPLPQNTGFRFPYPGIFPVQRDRRHPSRCGRKHETGKERTRNAVTGNGA